ncbi:MAG: serine hydrolase domain-containing protein [Bacteroidota bacterium]
MSVKSVFPCVKVSAVLIFMLFFQFVNAQTDFSEIDRKLDASKKELGGNVVALIYQDGKIVYQKAIGTDFNAKTQAPIGNASQWLTAALVMSFVDQGKISLDDQVSKYLPIFSKYSKGYITIKDCLAHVTGIESDPKSINPSNRKKFASLEEEVNDLASKKEILSNPGLEFRYGSVGLSIAGRVLEIVAKRSFEQLMQERITRPLQMRNTSFSSFNAVNPSNGAVSTPTDYISFLGMLLNKGMYNGKRILSEKAIEEMQTVRTTPSMMKFVPKVAEGYSYGLGAWSLQADENGKATIMASPGLFGTWTMIDFCRGYACVILTKGDLPEEKKEIWMEVKRIIESRLVPNCK